MHFTFAWEEPLRSKQMIEVFELSLEVTYMNGFMFVSRLERQSNVRA